MLKKISLKAHIKKKKTATNLKWKYITYFANVLDQLNTNEETSGLLAVAVTHTQLILKTG